MTPAQRAERIRKRDVAAKAYEQYLKQNPIADDLEGEERKREVKRRKASFYAKHPEYKPSPTRKEKVEQARKQREHAAKFVPPVLAQADKVLSLAGSKVNLTVERLYQHLRAQRHTMTRHELRRFVRETLQVTLRSERGKRRRDFGQ